MTRIAHIVAAGLIGLSVSLAASAAEAPPLSKGQTVYVPVYSQVQHGNQDRSGKPDEWLLSAMLSIRNTDPKSSIALRSVRYFDSKGKLLRDYPVTATLAPLESREVFIENRDTEGGVGANFLVVWDAASPVNAPIIETVHSNFYGNHSVVFTSPGQPLR